MSKNIEKWNQKYLSAKGTIPEPALVLKENVHLLPTKGNTLDLACGRGGNALFLARLGLTVSAWDFSTVAIDKLKQLAETEKLSVNAEVRDVSQEPPGHNSFDVIVVSYFLDREIANKLVEALKPHGILFYQTYTQDKTSEVGPKNPDYLLKENELLGLFRRLKVRVYREEKLCGNTKKGLRNEALFIGQKE